MMIRPARDADLDPIARIYEEVLDQEDARPVSYTNWQRGRYPTRDTARQALEEGTLWVLEEEGAVCGCVNLNGVQLPEYSQIPWSIPAAPEEVGGHPHPGHPPQPVRPGAGPEAGGLL